MAVNTTTLSRQQLITVKHLPIFKELKTVGPGMICMSENQALYMSKFPITCQEKSTIKKNPEVIYRATQVHEFLC